MIEKWSEMVGSWVIDSLGRRYLVAAVSESPSVLLEYQEPDGGYHAAYLTQQMGSARYVIRSFQIGLDAILLKDMKPAP